MIVHEFNSVAQPSIRDRRMLQRRHEREMQSSAAIHAEANRFNHNRRRHGIGVTAKSTHLLNIL